MRLLALIYLTATLAFSRGYVLRNLRESIAKAVEPKDTVLLSLGQRAKNVDATIANAKEALSGLLQIPVGQLNSELAEINNSAQAPAPAAAAPAGPGHQTEALERLSNKIEDLIATLSGKTKARTSKDIVDPTETDNPITDLDGRIEKVKGYLANYEQIKNGLTSDEDAADAEPEYQENIAPKEPLAADSAPTIEGPGQEQQARPDMVIEVVSANPIRIDVQKNSAMNLKEPSPSPYTAPRAKEDKPKCPCQVKVEADVKEEGETKCPCAAAKAQADPVPADPVVATATTDAPAAPEATPEATPCGEKPACDKSDKSVAPKMLDANAVEIDAAGNKSDDKEPAILVTDKLQ